MWRGTQRTLEDRMAKPKTSADLARSLDADWPPRQTITITDLVAEARCGVGALCVGERNAARKKAAVKGLAQVKQDKITIRGPKNDGTYVVEFKTADGVALAFSVPRGGEAAVLEYFQDKMPYGLAVPNVPRTISKSFYW